MNLPSRWKSTVERVLEKTPPGLPDRVEKVAGAIVRSPHTLLRLPRRHTLTFWRAIILCVGLGILALGVEELRLRVRCWNQLELTADQLAASPEGPLWVKVSGLAPRAEVAVESSESGSFKGIWLPLATPEKPDTVVAVVRAADRAAANRLQSGSVTKVQGLAYFPRPNELKNLGVYLSWLDKPAIENLRIIDTERAPMTLPLISLYFLAGFAIFVAAFLQYSEPEFIPEPLDEVDEEDLKVVIDDYRSEPLSEDFKLELSQVIDHAWSEVERHPH